MKDRKGRGRKRYGKEMGKEERNSLAHLPDDPEAIYLSLDQPLDLDLEKHYYTKGGGEGTFAICPHSQEPAHRHMT